MTRKTRRFIFYSFVFLFIITGAGVIFYSQGWRPVLADSKITFQKTGAIFISTTPKGVLIKIDEEVFKDKSGLIQSGTLINNLLPKNYKIEIEKDGYLSWHKNITVASGLVSQISKTVLIPKNLEKRSISLPKAINGFWMNSDEKIIFSAKGGSLPDRQAGASGGKDESNLYFETQNSPAVKLRGDKLITFSEDNNKIISFDSKTGIYYLYEINNLSQAFNINAAVNNLKKLTIKQIAFHSLDSSRLIIQDKNGLLYILNLNRPNLENIVEDPVLAWTVENPNIYYIKRTEDLKLKTKNYLLSSFNLLLKTENFNFELPSHLINQKISEISVSGNKIAFLSENGGLYLFNQQNQNLQQIAHLANNFAFSLDGKKIAFADKNNKLNIHFVEDYQNGIPKKAGEVISFDFYRKNGDIKKIYWYKDSAHLFIENQTSMDFIEIDDRLPVNKYTLLEASSNFNYEPNSNRLYFLENNEVYFSEL